MNRLALVLVLALAAKLPSQATGNPMPKRTLDSLQGTLNSETITLRLRSGSLEISFIPLDEQLIRLLAPNSYLSYHSLLTNQAVRLDSLARYSGVREPGVALVSFHALAPNTRFDPQLLTVNVQGQPFRAVGVLPMSGTFSNQQLDTGGSTSALFVFAKAIPLNQPFTVAYQEGVSEDWDRRLTRLDNERARILGRTRPDSAKH